MLTVEQKLREQKRRKLKSLTHQQVYSLAEVHGVREFHNGGQSRRFVVGIGLFVNYKTARNSRRTHGMWQDDFAKWCKGYVRDGIMYVIGEDGHYVEFHPEPRGERPGTPAGGDEPPTRSEA